MQQRTTIDKSKYIGREFGTVTLLKPVSEGSMALVFLGFQNTLNRQVIVKILPKTEKATDMLTRLFRNEAQLVAVLSHPNIVPIFEMGEADDCYYQVIQTVAGTDLEQLISKRTKHPIPSKRLFPLSTTIPLFMQILDGLGYAHDHGVVHQDIKPANILIERESRRPLIADFGIAKTRYFCSHQDEMVMGTPLYMAPEQVANEPTDRRTDIYSVGMMLFKALAGDIPLADMTPIELLARKIEAADTIFSKRPSAASTLITPQLEKIILTAIAQKPENRYQDCRSLKSELQRLRPEMQSENIFE